MDVTGFHPSASEVVFRIHSLGIGSCSCMTKTPDMSFHDEHCRARQASSIADLAILAFDQVASFNRRSALVETAVQMERRAGELGPIGWPLLDEARRLRVLSECRHGSLTGRSKANDAMYSRVIEGLQACVAGDITVGELTEDFGTPAEILILLASMVPCAFESRAA